MNPEPAPTRSEAFDYLFWWLSPVLLIFLGALCWSNHFEAGFHRDDFPNIVNNPTLRSGNLESILVSPRAFSKDVGLADYRPLLSLSFASDYKRRNDGQPWMFQMISFLWFIPIPFFVYALTRVIPGSGHRMALFSAALVALHPQASDTLNYISRRGEIIAAGGVLAALVVWVVWPHMLPQTLGIDLYRIPKTKWQEFLFKNGLVLERTWRRIRRAPAGFYFVPLIVGLLCSPFAAAFACVAAAWVWTFRPLNRRGETMWRRLIPGAIACGAWFVVHTAMTWQYAAPLRLPALQYYLGQPLVAAHYFVWYFLPFRMTADAGLFPELKLWPPDLILGVIAMGILIGVAVYARRREELRGVAFGIAWFLVSQIPFIILPQSTADSGARMFIPSIGLAIASAQVLMHLVFSADQEPRFGVSITALASLCLLGILGYCTWMTWNRNKIWATDSTLWSDTVRRSPYNQRALIHYAAELFRQDDVLVAKGLVERADKASPQDAQSEVLVAESLDRLGMDDRAEVHFKRATSTWPRYSAAMSSYGNWLYVHQRLPEATDWSQRALRLNFFDNQARRNLIELHSAAYEWKEVARVAKEALSIDSEDERAKLGLAVAQLSLDRVARAENLDTSQASFNDFLTLSVAYFREKRYEDCIKAAKAALKIEPGLGEAYANAATCYHALGQDDEAIAALRETVRLRPDFRVAWENLQILEQERAAKRAGGK